MKTTQWKEKAAELREKTTDLMNCELTLTKLDFILIGLICLMAGMCIGLLTAPFTHGLSISMGSNNGNNNTSNGGHSGSDNGNHESDEAHDDRKNN